MIIFGDIHSDISILKKIISVFEGQEMVSLGDLLDGKYGAKGSVECVSLCRKAAVQLVLGNHEAYPLYAGSDQELVKLWGGEWGSDTSNRIVAEWNAIKALLSDDDMSYLYEAKLFVQGDGWIAAHAKVRNQLNVSKLEVGKLTPEQVSFFDHTENWQKVVEYDGRYGHLYVGHTRWSKVSRKYDWGNVTLLDFDCKKGEAVGVACTETHRVWCFFVDGTVKQLR